MLVGGCTKTFDFIDFFAGQNQKSFRIVLYGSAAITGASRKRHPASFRRRVEHSDPDCET
jgi:hypothetical protein